MGNPLTQTASYYEPAEGSADGLRVRCALCPRRCVIPDSGAGFCGARVNRGGVLYADSYGLISSCALDPIEKKPLRHFMPGSMILSIGSFGCSFRCPFCQNHEISFENASSAADFVPMPPGEVAALAEKLTPRGNIGVAYTYNEPLISYEFVRDCAALIRESRKKNVLITNGYISEEPLRALLPFIDALNIDLKAYTGEFYEKIGGNLAEVKRTIAISSEYAHVEVTTLVIPGENEEDIPELARFVAGVNPGIPLHLSRFFPRHRMADKAPTPKETILRLKTEAEKYLRYVYAGNMR